ncbi:MAG TPA: MFS transporter, partial [Gemmataceae bacterium]|nr:MFS transporter [Gemmataceae bacterium]
MTSPSASPTRVRYSILVLLCTLAMITYLDRAMNGNAKKDMMESIGRTEADFFWVLTAFQIAYAIFEIPTGWMGDTYGPRKTLLRIVLWWSLFVGLTGCTGLAWPGSEAVLIGFGALIVIQFLFGVGEAG